MFSFICACCGHPEMAHQPEGDVCDWLENGLWPNEEFRDENPIGDPDLFFAWRRGYRYSLLRCPGFRYRQNDLARVTYTFADATLRTPWIIDFCPDLLQAKARQILEELLRAEEAASEKRAGLPNMGGGSIVYTIFDPAMGSSYCLYR